MAESSLSATQSVSSGTPQGRPLTSIFAIIVCYRLQPMQSPSLRTLLAAADIAASPGLRLAIAVADNTPGGQNPGTLPGSVRYRAYPHNPGLAEPYNDAMAAAAAEGFDWLLTLDQDTHLPPGFLQRVHVHADRYIDVMEVGAIVPHILDNGRRISPFRYIGGFLPRVLTAETEGISGRHTSALNSTSLLRLSALRQIGGYDSRFPLHNSDTDLYKRLDEAGRRVAVAGDLQVGHELAILQRAQRMKPERYRQMLRDECEYWDLRMGMFGRTERLIRLAGRVCKGYLRGEAAEFRSIAARELRYRLFTRHSSRILLPGASDSDNR